MQQTEPNQPPEEAASFEEEVDLIDYLRVIVHYRWLIVVGVLVCGLGAGLVGRDRPGPYPVQFVLMPTSADDDVQNRHPFGAVRARNAHYLDLLRSFPVAQRVARQEYQVHVDGQTVKGPLTDCLQALSRARRRDSGPAADSETDQLIIESNTAAALQKMLTVEQQDAGIMDVEIQAPSPELAMQIAHAYIKSFREYDEHLRNQSTRAKLAIVKTRLDSVTLELGIAEQEERRLLARNSGLAGKDDTFELPGLNLELRRVQRQVAVKSKLYDMLLQIHETARIEATALTTAIEVLSPPTPLRSENRARWKTTLIGCVVGGFLSIIAAFLLQYWAHQEPGKTDFVREALRRDWRRLASMARVVDRKPR